jgi:hypothetical protein
MRYPREDLPSLRLGGCTIVLSAAHSPVASDVTRHCHADDGERQQAGCDSLAKCHACLQLPVSLNAADATNIRRSRWRRRRHRFCGQNNGWADSAAVRAITKALPARNTPAKRCNVSVRRSVICIKRPVADDSFRRWHVTQAHGRSLVRRRAGAGVRGFTVRVADAPRIHPHEAVTKHRVGVTSPGLRSSSL